MRAQGTLLRRSHSLLHRCRQLGAGHVWELARQIRHRSDKCDLGGADRNQALDLLLELSLLEFSNRRYIISGRHRRCPPSARLRYSSRSFPPLLALLRAGRRRSQRLSRLASVFQEFRELLRRGWCAPLGLDESRRSSSCCLRSTRVRGFLSPSRLLHFPWKSIGFPFMNCPHPATAFTASLSCPQLDVGAAARVLVYKLDAGRLKRPAPLVNRSEPGVGCPAAQIP